MAIDPIKLAELREYVRTANSFQQYRDNALQQFVDYRRDRIDRLPEAKKIVYSRLVPHLDKVAECIELNGHLTGYIGEFAHTFAQDEGATPDLTTSQECLITNGCLHESRVFSTLRQIAREWTKAGEQERQESFGLVCAELEKRFPPETRSEINILVPGSGLGRLPFEIATRGFSVTGNEYNSHMLFAGYFIQNYLKTANMLEIAPFVHNFSGNWHADDQVQRLLVPDVAPSDFEESSGKFRQSIGNFFESAANFTPQDVIVTCFFLDAIPDIVKAIETITCLVKKGGLWINFGPLLWHYEHIRPQADDDDEYIGGLEIDFETLISLIKENGWTITEQSTHKTTYCQDRKRMMVYEYTCEFFVAQKN